MIAERPHAGFALADPHEGRSERGPDDPPEDPEGDEERREHQVVEGNGVGEGPGQAEVRAGDSGDAVVALCQRHPSVGEAPHDHAEGQCDHEEVNARGTQGHQAEDGGDGRREQHADGQCDPETGPVPRRQDADAVRADAQVGGVTQRGQADVPKDDVQAHGQDRVDHGLREQCLQERRDERRGDGQQPEDDGDRDSWRTGRQRASRHARPKSPVGRTARIAAIGANRVK